MIKFLCGVSFQHELGECSDIKFYDSVEDLKGAGECWYSCGIVQIEYEADPINYTSFKWIEEQDFSKTK
jgi:hypothetical protein